MSEKRISRTRNRIAIILLVTFLTTFLLGCLMDQTILLYVAIICATVSWVIMIDTNRCPHCGTFFRGLYWSKEAGFCQKCGKRILFDDEE